MNESSAVTFMVDKDHHDRASRELTNIDGIQIDYEISIGTMAIPGRWRSCVTEATYVEGDRAYYVTYVKVV